MTNNADYRYAKQLFNDHVAEHKCKAGHCPERRKLWDQLIRVAGRLGKP